MRIKTSSAKAKGRNLQNLVAKKIAELLNLPYGKDEDVQGRPMGQSGQDIILSKEAQKLFPYSIECKANAKIAIYKWIDQAKSNQKEGTDWMVVCRADRKKPVVILDLEIFFSLLEKMNE